MNLIHNINMLLSTKTVHLITRGGLDTKYNFLSSWLRMSAVFNTYRGRGGSALCVVTLLASVWLLVLTRPIVFMSSLHHSRARQCKLIRHSSPLPSWHSGKNCLMYIFLKLPLGRLHVFSISPARSLTVLSLSFKIFPFVSLKISYWSTRGMKSNSWCIVKFTF